MNIGLEEKRAISEAYEKVVRCDEKFKGDLIGISRHVRTFAILTAENPFAQRLSRSANRERNDILERSLKEMNFVFRKVKGFYGTEDGGGNGERSYCVYNMSLSSAKYLAAKFNQQSFVFGEASVGDFDGKYRGNRMTYSFYAYRQKKYDEAFERFRKDNEGVEEEIFRRYPKFDGANYVKVDEKRTFDTNREDVYSRKNDFRFTIPFDFFSDEDAVAAGKEIDECAKRVGEERFCRLLADSVDDSLDGKRQYHSRVMMYGRKGGWEDGTMMFGLGESKRIEEAYGNVVEGFRKDLVGVSDYIRTFAILTAEKPRLSVKGGDGRWRLESERMTAHENNERNGELRDILRRGHYVFRAVEGDYDGIERPFMILNATLSAAKRLAARFDQEAFIFAERKRPSAADGERGSNMEYSFYAVGKSHAPSETKEFRHADDDGFGTSSKTVGVKTADMYARTDSRSSIDYDPDAKAYFSRKGDFRFTIPFEKFDVEEAVELYRQRERDLGKRRFDELMDESLEDDGIGKVAWRRRIEILGEK